MKKKYFKILSLFLSLSTIFTSIQPSYAYNMENNNSVETIEYQSTEDEDFSNSLNVFAELASIYKVTIPKIVVLSGESKDASYFVKVEGDIAGYEQISVIPDESFNLYTKKKDPQEAFVTQDKTIWHVSDFDIDANGLVEANGITAGKWSGVFYFNINLEDGEKVAGDIIIPPDLPLDDDYRLIIEKISDAPGLYDDNFTLILPWPEIAKRIEGGETISQIVNSCPGGIYLSIPQGTSTIPTNYLPDTNIKYIYVPDTVTTIQTTSCPGSPIKGVFLPKSTKVEPGAFDNTPAGENKQVYVGGQRIVDTIIDINTLPEREEDIKDEDALILEKGCKYQITALYNFYDDVTKESTIKSSNPDVVKFIPDCTLEALEVGTSIISGKYFGPLGERNAYLLVKVIDTGYSKGNIPSNTHKHTVGPLQEENKVLATCTEDGHVDQVFYCSDCNKELGRRTIPIYAIGHTEGEWVIVKKATESETGLKEQRCTICNELLKSEVIEKLPNTDKHTDVKYVYRNKIGPTCTENGSQDKIAICNVCGKEVEKTTEILPATGHTKGEYKIVKNATCSEKGLKEQRCMVCGELLDSEEIPMTQHIEKSAVKENEVPATCTKEGSYDEVVYCSICNTEISRTIVKMPALGHDYKETVINPTHKEKGYTLHTCSRCGDSYKDNETDVIAHTYDAGKVTKEATCTEDGIKTYTCSCGDVKTETIPKLGHDYEDTIIAPTCTTDGYTKHVCNRCGDSYEDNIVSKLGHNYVEGTCTRCGDVLPALSVTANGFTGNYDGKAHSITVTSSGNTISYSTDNKTWTTTNPTYTNAGTYTVYYKVSKDGYKTVTGSQKVVINKIASTLNTAPTAKTGLVYTGSVQSLVNAGTATNGTIQYKLGNGSYSTSIPSITDAGTYNVYYKVIGDANYSDIAEQKLTITIAKKAGYINTKPTGKTLTYNGNNQNLITAGSDASGTIQYSLDNKTWQTTIPQGKDVKTYTIYYKVDASTNFNAISASSIKTTINKGNSTISTTPSAKTLTFNNTDQTLINAGSATNGTMQYKLNNGSYSTTIPKAKNAGTYTVYYKVIGNANYNDIAEKSISVTINKANSTLTKAPTAKTGLVYTGRAQTLINAGSATNGTIQYKLNNGSYSTSLPSATNGGTYTIYYKVVGNTNYNDVAEKSIKVSIGEKSYTLTYNVNGGNALSTTSKTVKNNDTFGTLPTPTRTGYTFDGWYTSASGGTKITSTDKFTGNANKTIYAHWTAINYTITYELDGGTMSGQKTSYNIETPNFTLPIPKKEGYVFEGWSGSKVSGRKESVTINKGTTGNLTYTAHWGVPIFIGTGKDAGKSYSYYQLHEMGYMTTSNLSSNEYNGPIFSDDGIDEVPLQGKLVFNNTGEKNIGISTLNTWKNIESVYIGPEIIWVDSSAFNHSNNISEIVVDSKNTKYNSKNNCNAIIETSTNRLVKGCKNTIIPNTVKIIGKSAFALNNLNAMTIPEGVQSIEAYAFSYCPNLKTMNIPNSVTSIDKQAFIGCTNLTTVTLGTGLKYMNIEVFDNCKNLTSVTFKNTTGWYVVRQGSVNPKQIDVNVTNPSQNAIWLKASSNSDGNYFFYHWYRR